MKFIAITMGLFMLVIGAAALSTSTTYASPPDDP